MTALIIISSEELDHHEYSNLQKLAFARVLKKYSVSTDYMSPAFYTWKYSPPSGNGLIAAVFEGNNMVSVTAAIPLPIRKNRSRILGWRCFDVATLPSAQGKGYFFKCLDALKNKLGKDQILFGYPNKFSVRGFMKIGCQESETLDYWIKPVFFSRESDHSVTEASLFNETQDSYANYLVSLGKTILQRDSGYMNWRYCQHPLYKYKLFIFLKNGKQRGFAVVRKAKIFNITFLLLMEFWGDSKKVEKTLLNKVQKYAINENIRFLFSINNYFKPNVIQKYGFIRIPLSLSPKKQILRGFSNGEFAENIFKSKWIVQMGDLFEF